MICQYSNKLAKERLKIANQLFLLAYFMSFNKSFSSYRNDFLAHYNYPLLT